MVAKGCDFSPSLRDLSDTSLKVLVYVNLSSFKTSRFHKLNKSEHSFNFSYFLVPSIALDLFPCGASPQGSTREAAQHGITSQVAPGSAGEEGKSHPNSFAHLGEVRKIHGFESAFVKGKGNMKTP